MFIYMAKAKQIQDSNEESAKLPMVLKKLNVRHSGPVTTNVSRHLLVINFFHLGIADSSLRAYV